MATLYVTEQGAVLRKTGERLVVEKDRTVLLEVPCRKLDAVLIYGNVQVTTQALAELLEHGVELALLSAGGKLRCQLTPPKARNVPLRMRQYEVAASEAACLPLARELVRGKIANQAAVLRRFRVNHPEAVDAGDVAELERAAAGVDRAASLEILRGIEGAAAARHFRALAGMVPPELRFEGRSRRPPRDPVNALLSLGYVLAGNELQSLLDAMGFDPYLGFFHRLDYGRPSLALDLVKEFRAALVDRFVTGLFNRRGVPARRLHEHAGRRNAAATRGIEAVFPGLREGADDAARRCRRRGRRAHLPAALPPAGRAAGASTDGGGELRGVPAAMLIVVSYDVPDDQLGGQNQREPSSRPQERQRVDHEVSPGGGQAGQPHARLGGAPERPRPLLAGELLVPDVGRVADHHVDAARGTEEGARRRQREEVGGPQVARGSAQQGAEPFPRDRDRLGIEVDGVEESRGRLGIRAKVAQPAGGGLEEDTVAAGRVQHRLVGSCHRPGDHRLDQAAWRVEGADALALTPLRGRAVYGRQRHSISAEGFGGGSWPWAECHRKLPHIPPRYRPRRPRVGQAVLRGSGKKYD